MPRGNGYTSLPDGNEDEEFANNGTESGQIAVSSSAGAAATGLATAVSAGGPQDGATASAIADTDIEKKSSSGKQDQDLGGLPTAEGVYVGSPVPQSSYSHVGGGGGQATVITSTPPSYDSHMVAAAAVASAEGGGGVAVTAGGHQVVANLGHAQPPTVILVNGPGYTQWGRGPQAFVCQACGFSGLSHAMTDPCSNAPILAAACCCLLGLWFCSFVPFLVAELRDTVHRCPNCHVTVGRSRQFR